MSQPQALKRVVETLDRLGIDYLVGGSIACTVQGGAEPAPGIHLVVALTPDKVDPLLAAFDPHAFNVQREAVERAVRPDAAVPAFTLLCLDEGEAVAFWVLTGDPFDQSRFGRRVAAEVAGVPVKLSAPEDTILAQLHRAQRTGGGPFSDEQYAAARCVYRRQRDALDRDYLNTWAAQLGVGELWAKLQSEPTSPSPPRWSVRLTKKQFVYGGLAALVIVCGWILFIGYVTYCPIEPGRVARIQRGMTEAQVEVILGGRCTFDTPQLVHPPKGMPAFVKIWVGRRATCQVWFDADRSVEHVVFYEHAGSGIGMVDRLRALVGL